MNKKEHSFTKQDKKFMRLALKLAAKAKGLTSPNPMVGAVIVYNGKIISSGYHKKAGLAHAEIEAINSCEDKKLLKGADIYITLEPCSFYGKTPPCTETIIKYGFGKVIVAAIDPNPKVSGNGIKRLREAGIDVKTGLFEIEAIKQNEVFFKHIKTGMPFVTIKIAASIDGKTAAASGNSKWITGVKSRNIVQKLRYESDCILTGINTVLADNPLLYPRDIEYNKNIKNNNLFSLNKKKFYRVVLDSNLKIPLDFLIVNTASEIKTIIFTLIKTKQDNNFENKLNLLKQKGIDIVFAPNDMKNGIDLEFVLKTLYSNYEITSVLVEGGKTLNTSLVKKNLADKFVFFIAPKIIGGESSYSMFSELGIKDVNSAFKIRFDLIKKIAGDLMITAYPLSILST